MKNKKKKWNNPQTGQLKNPPVFFHRSLFAFYEQLVKTRVAGKKYVTIPIVLGKKKKWRTAVESESSIFK